MSKNLSHFCSIVRHYEYLFVLVHFNFDIAHDVVTVFSFLFYIIKIELSYSFAHMHIWTRIYMHTCTISTHKEESREPSIESWLEGVKAAFSTGLEAKTYTYIYTHIYIYIIEGTPRSQT